jgi:hypothetical protein
MRSIVKKLLALSLLLSLPLVTGCDKGANPMAPEVNPPPQTEYVDVTVTLLYVYTPADGDGIEGFGDFDYEAIVSDGPGALVVSGYREIDTGASVPINRSKVVRVEKGAPYNIKVSFRATEWDWPVIGDRYPDTRLNNLGDYNIHSNGATGRNGFNAGECSLTVGEGDCRLMLYYKITSKPVV